MELNLRVVICIAAVFGFSVYAWRNWYVSLCASVLLMAFLEHPDMPHNIAGIQGLNPWNLLMLNVLGAWWVQRREQGLVWDMPRKMMKLLIGYLLIIFWSYLRLVTDSHGLKMLDDSHVTRGITHYTFAWLTSENLINAVKWVVPGLLLFDASRTRRRVLTSLVVILLLYFLLALQVLKHMPISYVTASEEVLTRTAAMRLVREVGYHRVNLSMMLAGAAWAILSTIMLVKTRRSQLMIIGAAAIVSLAQALTGGRAGYVTWGLVGMILCLMRWRQLLWLIPVTIVAVCIFLPTVRDRMLQGFTGDQGDDTGRSAAFQVTSGRILAWAKVIPKIESNPIFGYGRQAMIRLGLYQQIVAENGEGEEFPHPHNAYLECLLDNGLIGFVIVMMFYYTIVRQSFSLLMDRSDPLYSAVGGAACALVLSLLFASMGSQSFYPSEGSFGMWAAIGLMLRVYVERDQFLNEGIPPFGEEPQEGSATEIADGPMDDIAAPA